MHKSMDKVQTSLLYAFSGVKFPNFGEISMSCSTFIHFDILSRFFGNFDPINELFR
jgi:hypothetical protein